jgi:hypothetical protein
LQSVGVGQPQSAPQLVASSPQSHMLLPHELPTLPPEQI